MTFTCDGVKNGEMIYEKIQKEKVMIENKPQLCTQACTSEADALTTQLKVQITNHVASGLPHEIYYNHISYTVLPIWFPTHVLSHAVC